MTEQTTRHTSNGMHTRLVANAADVISRAMQQGRTLPAALAVALDSAQLLQSPDTAARLTELEKANAGLDNLRVMALDKNDTLRARITELEADRAANDREYEAATARVAELETERHTTNEALSDAAEQLRANRDRITELEKAAVDARAALGSLCYDLQDPGTAALGALYLLTQATTWTETGPDFATDALAQHASKVLQGVADIADPEPPEISFFGDHGSAVADWLRMLAHRKPTTEQAEVQR